MAQHTGETEAEVLRAQLAALEAELRDTRRDLEELRHKESLYRGLVELAPDAIMVHDHQARIVYINAAGAQLFGADTPDQILGTLATSYVPPDMRGTVERDIDRVIDGDIHITRLD